MKRLKVLMSAYACEPGKGSEPGVGWNVAREMAKHHDVWVLTRANNRPAIEAELAREPVPGLRFAYYDLPRWARWWKRGGRGVQLYYYLWQLGAYCVARRLHREVGFDLAHHVTFVKYWVPSFVSLLPVPFVWGPVGGGESAPKAFWQDFSPQGQRYERLREWARWLGEHDPFVRFTARRSRVALATTEDTAARLRSLGIEEAQVLSQVGVGPQEFARIARAAQGGKTRGFDGCALSTHEIEELGRMASQSSATLRLISMGRLLHWKGYHLSIRAFAEAALHDTEYWILGSGSERAHLEALAKSLGVAANVRFLGNVQRPQALEALAGSIALLHPSLHDSGGWVCLEAMAAGKPVICLDLGGPAVQVTPETGFKVAAQNPEQAVRDMAEAMRRLAEDEGLRQRMGEAGRRRVCQEFSWERKGEILGCYYEEAMRGKA